jgi:hypothetical protein
MSYERYKCDRNGGFRARYLQRAPWVCASCGDADNYSGHRCGDCRRRICCACFHHDLACCLGAPGSDIPGDGPPNPAETCLAAIARKGLDPNGGGKLAQGEKEK